MPTNERQLRFLAKAELEPSVQADVWQQAVEQAGNKIPSGRIVKGVVDRIRERTKVSNPHHVGETCILLPKITQTGEKAADLIKASWTRQIVMTSYQQR